MWRFYTVPGDPHGPPDGAASDEVLRNVALRTWSGDWLKYVGGGQVWNALVYDPDFNQLYMATGNGFPWNQNYRSDGGGDNLFISSIIAVDADTGQYRWHYQETPGDRWDYDAIADMTLVDLPLPGGTRKVLLHAPKNGFLYVIDRRTGKPCLADPYVPGINWATGVDLKTGRPKVVAGPWTRMRPGWVSPGAGAATTGIPWRSNRTSARSISRRRKARRSTRRPRTTGTTTAWSRSGSIWTPPPMGQWATRPHMPPRKDYLLAWNPLTRKAAFSVPGRGGGLSHHRRESHLPGTFPRRGAGYLRRAAGQRWPAVVVLGHPGRNARGSGDLSRQRRTVCRGHLGRLADFRDQPSAHSP